MQLTSIFQIRQSLYIHIEQTEFLLGREENSDSSEHWKKEIEDIKTALYEMKKIEKSVLHPVKKVVENSKINMLLTSKQQIKQALHRILINTKMILEEEYRFHDGKNSEYWETEIEEIKFALCEVKEIPITEKGEQLL